MRYIFYFLFIAFIIGCGSNKSDYNFGEENSSFSNVNIVDNGKSIFMVMSSVVGLDNYIIGTLSDNYSSIITVANPYKITYVNCFLERNESDYFLYSCDSYQTYCDNSFECIQIYTDKDKEMYISKNNPTYLYEESILDDKKYAIGEFRYKDKLIFEEYSQIKEIE